MRWLTPAVLLAAAAFIAWYDAGGHGRVIAFPFLASIFPSLRSDPLALGRASAGLLAALGVVLGLLAARKGA